ncbi:MAG: hypothetical protein U5K79_01520 [Cyclobacteriaceae bacterium]|nr:hypothetical protein [Cyclobacteriaceae bacterium]
MNKFKLGIVFIGLLSMASICQAQSPSDSIYYSRNFWGTKFFQDNYRINFNQLPGLVGSDMEAANLMRQARANKTGAAVISGIGGFLLGWQIGTWIVGGEPNWVVAGVGEGLILVSIPFSSKANKLAIQAVDIHNQKLSAYRNRPEFSLGFAQGGMGLRIHF